MKNLKKFKSNEVLSAEELQDLFAIYWKNPLYLSKMQRESAVSHFIFKERKKLFPDETYIQKLKNTLALVSEGKLEEGSGGCFGKW